MFNFISLELCLFAVVIMTYTRFRKKKVFSLEMIREMTIYMPPTQEDFDVLTASRKPPRENAKGKKNRFDKRANQ